MQKAVGGTHRQAPDRDVESVTRSLRKLILRTRSPIRPESANEGNPRWLPECLRERLRTRNRRSRRQPRLPPILSRTITSFTSLLSFAGLGLFADGIKHTAREASELARQPVQNAPSAGLENIALVFLFQPARAEFRLEAGQLLTKVGKQPELFDVYAQPCICEASW